MLRPLVLSLAVLATPAAADPGAARACVAERAQAGEAVADCVNRAQAACFQYEEGAPAGIACFREMREDWAAEIALRMDEIGAQAPEEIAAIAGVEVKYDLRRNLLECERMQELRLLRQEMDTGAMHAMVRCEATAVGLAYVKLLLQSGAAER
ncbi:hypothetical protein DXV76_15655 [Rhodobacteraceae bacterium CCMM004]|nr:hypothetical protein DXV76_15655 [Rhodobacteraceae bacterium CCMM004]